MNALTLARQARRICVGSLVSLLLSAPAWAEGPAPSAEPPAVPPPTEPQPTPDAAADPTTMGEIPTGVGPQPGPLESSSPSAVVTAPTTDAPDDRARYRGSRVSLRSSSTAVSFNKGAGLTYDPYVALRLALEPRYWLTEKIYARARMDFSRELTHSNITTRRGETLLGDLALGGGTDALWTVPRVGVELSAELMLRLPTSQATQARSLVLALEPTLGAAKTFPVLGGLSVGYGFSPELYFHRYTTAQQDEPLIPSCALSPSGCERYFNTGERNAWGGQSHVLQAGLRATRWLSVSAAAGLHVQYLYDAVESDAVTFEPQQPTNQQYAQSYLVELSTQAHPAVGLALGASTFSPQLRPDASRYAPLFNRYTQVYLDVRLDPEAIVQLIRPRSVSASGGK